MATGHSIARKAFEQLEDSIHTAEQQVFSNTTVADVWQAVRDICKEQDARRDLRFMRRIEPFIRTVDGYSEIFGVLCQGWPPMSFIWGPIKWILVMAKNYFDIIDTVLQAYKDIADNLPRIDLLRSIFPENERLNRTVGWIYSDLLEFHGRAYKMFRRRAWHFYFALDWGLYQKRFKSILQRLSRHCDILDKEATAAHFAEMRTFRDQRREEDEAFEKRRRLQMFQDVITWLSGSEDAQEEYLHQVSDARQAGTCNWILKDPTLSRWVDDGSDGGALWINGNPGSGKSFLASMIVDHIRSRRDECCAFFFCGHRGSADVTCVEILRTFSTQILRDNPDMAPLIHEAFLQRGFGRTTAALEKLLAQTLPEIHSTHFVLDGLDELELSVQEEILKSLPRILKSTKVNSSILISSRDVPPINKFPFHNRIKLEGKTTHALGLYVQNNVKELRSSREYIDDHLSNEIETNLLEKASGMFLWVRLVLAMLNERGTYTEMKLAISDLPDGLEEAYGRILSRIKGQLSTYQRRRVFRILSWLCVSRRPVSIYEVIDGIALDFEQRELNIKTRISNPDIDIFDLCAPLLDKSPSTTLKLVHFSAKEYLLSSKSGRFLKDTLAHFHIAQSCIINTISALDFIPLHSNLDDEELDTRTAKGTYGLMAYSSEFWVDHVLCFLSESDELDPGKKHNILMLLKSLLRLTKGRREQIAPSHVPGLSSRFVKGLKELDHDPELSQLVTSSLELPLKLSEIKANFDDAKQQEERLLLSDNTFMTLIACRLREATNRILTLADHTSLPRIEPIDYRNFVNRFGWRCKYIGCTEEFKSRTDRNTHEENHVISFPCSYCDFFFKGFRSRKELDRHVRTYHLDSNDFEVPTSLHHNENNAHEMTMTNISQKKQLRCWNKRGTKAAQEGLQQILKSIRSSLEEKSDGSDRVASSRTQPLAADALKQKIDQNQYDSLEGFKQDLRQIMIGPDSQDNVLVNHAIEIACQNGLRNATADYPGFASTEGSLLTNLALRSRTPSHAVKSVAQVEPQADVEAIQLRLAEESLRNRDVYWSKVERAEFPNLLRKFGKEFLKVAEELGTKSEEDVDRFFNHLIKERPDIEEIVLNVDFKPESVQKQDHKPSPAVEMVGTMHLEPSSRIGPPPAFVPPTGISESTALQNLTDSISSQNHQQSPGDNAPNTSPGRAGSTHLEMPPRKKRVRPRAYCSNCTYFPNGLHDEYALQKHVNRYHRTHRKVWTCNDSSIDKTFLRDCNACKIGKRYKTKHDASQHLRFIHFTPGTTPKTLNRWMQELEEPNPNFGLSPWEKPPKIQESKRQKSDEAPLQIAPLKSAPKDNTLLPSMRMEYEVNGAGNITGSTSDHNELSNNMDGYSSGLLTTAANFGFSSSMSGIEDHNGIPSLANQSEPLENVNKDLVGSSRMSTTSDPPAGSIKAMSRVDNKSHADTILPDVSFDNLIGLKGSISSYYDVNGPPHRSKQALIKPDQVDSLPHLSQARKLVCEDQVEALFYRLDREDPETEKYKEQLKKLEELSRTLMRNLKDWQREQSRAPNLPFSLN